VFFRLQQLFILELAWSLRARDDNSLKHAFWAMLLQ
jgi:hypothetical protein